MPNIGQLLLPVTPLAALCSFRIEVSPKAVRRLCGNLLSNDSLELQWAARQLYAASRQQWPEQFNEPLESEAGPESLNNIIAKLADEKLNLNSSDIQPVKLLAASPRLEFDLLAESIYPYSTLSLEEIVEEVSDWSYQQKFESLKQAVAEPGLLLDKVNYKFDLITDHMILEELTALIASEPSTQNPSPRNGYDVPPILETIGIDEMFIECFDDSLELFSALQAIDRDDLTIYSSLLGHKLRWQLNISAQELKVILEHKGSEALGALTRNMREQAGESHPLMWDVMHGTFLEPAATHKNRVKPARRRPSRRRK
jgi:hypothetical protein